MMDMLLERELFRGHECRSENAVISNKSLPKRAESEHRRECEIQPGRRAQMLHFSNIAFTETPPSALHSLRGGN